MPRDIFYRLRKAFIVLCILVLVFGVGYWVYNELTFRVTGINPTAKTFSVATPFFKVTFNKVLASTGITVTSSPKAINSYYVSGRTIVIELAAPLDPSTTYTFNLYNINDKSGKHHITSKSYSFKPNEVTTLPKDQQKAQVDKQAKYSNMIGNDPLLQQLPFTGPGGEFDISYNATYTPDLKITVIITAASQSAQTDAMTWITSQGIDPGKYTIQYITAQP